MSARIPIPTKLIIDLRSSSPLQRNSPPVNDSLVSSPLLPLPSEILSQFNAEKTLEKMEEEGSQPLNKGKVDITPSRDIPGDTEEVLLPQLIVKKKRTTKATADTVAAKKPRAPRKTTTDNAKTGKKKVPSKEGKLKAKVVKNSEKNSKYFVEGPRKETIYGLNVVDQEPHDVPAPLDTTLKKYTLAPKSPNQQQAVNSPLHITRRQWTPVKDTNFTIDSSSPLDGGSRKSKRSAFEDMVGVMRYSTNSLQSSREVSPTKEDPINKGLRNKRPIEMIDLPSVIITAKEKQPKLPKKRQPKRKPKTTDQATSQFLSAGNPVDTPVLAYFAMNESESIDLKNSLRKPGSPTKKKRKLSPEVIILLSPTSARKRFDDQDFVFGTCSQLEKTGDDEEEEAIYDNQPQIGIDDQNDDYVLPPPSTSVVRRDFLKSLAKERKGGSIPRERNAENGKLSIGYGDANVVTNCMREQPHQDARQGGSQLGKVQKTAGGLWSAAARDLDGELMSVEVVDITSSDNGRLESESAGWSEGCTVRELSRDKNVTTGSNATGRSVAQDEPLESCHRARREPLLVEEAVCKSSHVQTIESLGDTSHAIITKPLERSAESADNITANISVRTKAKRFTACEKTKLAPIMPDFQSYPTPKLKVEVAKFGFKDMGTRDRMVSCLEMCWEAKNKAATARSTPQQPEASAGPVENTAELPERGPNEEEAAPVLQEAISIKIVAKGKRYARRRSKSPRQKSPKRKTASKSKESSSKVSSHDGDGGDPNAIEPPAKVVHYRISEAVRESGRTEPESSFYHAILMYDPIILEDMTLWLNTKDELRDLRIDEEVVKAWCEANGVCCVRKETLAGKERKRF